MVVAPLSGNKKLTKVKRNNSKEMKRKAKLEKSSFSLQPIKQPAKPAGPGPILYNIEEAVN